MNTEEPVAIVGYGYRLPGGIRSDADFWRLLAQREVVREPVFERYGRGHRPLGGARGFDCRFASAWEGLMRDGEELLFDYRLFGISQNEAKYMDPQMKLLLTCAWETFEHAGWDLHRLRNSPTGVFVGTQLSSASAWRSNLDVNEFILTGKSLAMLANRVSYQFNLMGPSISVNTACSAGMSALHAAVNALRQGDCRQALVGSVNYLGAAAISAYFHALGVISADGRCHSFDAAANGYMRSEGTFLTALKPLAAAERDGDLVHAVVEATAVNTAGTADDVFGLEPGRYITAPTRHAQVALMRAACARAGRTPREFDYVEAHATGTRLGDRIEGDSIGEAFGGFERGEPLRVSSVKSNVGHMEAAAFHCSLLKIVLMIQRRTFAPISGNFVAPNPEIDFAGHNMQVQTACEPFPDRPVVVGINSFGFGGANGHCVLGEYRPARRPRPSVALAPRAGFMFPVSARSADALAATVGRLRNTLAERPADLYTLAGNLSRRRTHFAARTAFVARSHDELLDALDAFRKESGCSFTAAAGERRLVMVFAGQGTQWAGCARTLYDTHPVFRRAVDAVETHWRTHADLSLREACFAASQEALDECRLAQPCIFMIQCALVEVFKTWGVYPDCVVGHSSGEAAAAYACGALSLADATRLIFHRSTLQQRTAGSGRMLAIGLDRPGVEALLAALGVPLESSEPASAAVTIACENSPANTVICGREAVLQAVREELDRHRLQHRLLRGDIAFHSPAMEPIRHDVLESLSFLDDRTFDGDAPFVSSVTGLETDRLDSRYWWSNIRRPVRFAAAMETVRQVFRPHVVLEVSPHGALRALVNQCFEDAADRPTSIATLTKDSDARTDLHRALGNLFQTGVQLDFAAQYPRPEPVAHLLPGHPKDEKPVIDPLIDDETFVRQGRFSHGPLVGRRIPGDGMRFEVRLSGKTFPDLLDHRVDGVAIVPAAGYVEMVLEALGDGPVHFDELDFARPCPIPTRVPVYLQTVLQQVAGTEEQFTFTISSHPIEGGTSEVHCRGAIRRVTGDCAVDAPRRLEDVDATRFEPTWCTQPDDFYERIDATLGGNFQYGPAFRTVQRIDVDAGNLHLLAETAMDEGAWKAAREEGALWPAPLLDSALQLSIFFQLETSDTSAAPKGARRVTLFRPPSTPRLICHWKLSPSLRNAREKGQLAARMESASVGAASLYDAATGDLVGHVGDYSVGVFRDKRSRLPRSRHVVHWQPKFVPASFADGLPTGDLEPAALVAALERAGAGRGVHHALHVAELADGRVPDQTILEECIGHLASTGSQSEYWLLAGDADTLRAYYEAFHHHDAALRFECLSLDARSASGPDAGRLGPASVELVFVHADGAAPACGVWRFLRRLSVPGGLALVRHDAGDAVAPGDGWSVVRAGRRTTLLQAPPTWAEIESAEGRGAPRGLRWVIGEPGSGVDAWLSLPEVAGACRIPWESRAAGEAQSPEPWPAAADLEALDFFCGDDGRDPTGEALVARFVALVQALISHRTSANRVCRLTVVTQEAAFEIRNPRGAALWGAVRSVAAEVAADARLDFRLVDVGAASDLQTLAQLSLCDLRERELAVRRGRLWAPRLISLVEEFARVPAADDPPYRLFVDRPGQITGLRMRTCEAAEPGPRDVEIEVRAAGLNFRDVMVALDLLPPLSYERSALGREVGMEGSGTVRGVGRAVRRCRVGDEVVFLKGGCIANRVAADDRLVFLKPERLSMAEAAAGLSAHLTAYYALIHLARLRPGQRVLIHSAMGGVGQAGPRAGQTRRRRDLRDGRHAAEARPVAGAGRQGGLRFAQPRLVRRPAARHGRRGHRRGPELAGRAPSRAVSRRAASGRLPLRDRQARHLRRQRARPARLPQEPALRRGRCRPFDARRSGSPATALQDLPRPAGDGSAAGAASHRLPVRGSRRRPAADDERPARGEARPRSPRRRSRISRRRQPAPARSWRDVSGDRGAERVRPAGGGIPGGFRGAASHPGGPRPPPGAHGGLAAPGERSDSHVP